MAGEGAKHLPGQCTWIPKEGVRTTVRWVGGNTPCSNRPTELDKSVSKLTCVIRDAGAFAKIVAVAVAWSSEGLNQWAELKREWWVGQKRERAPGSIFD